MSVRSLRQWALKVNNASIYRDNSDSEAQSMIPDFEIRRLRGGEFGIEALTQRAQKARGMGPGDTKIFVRWHEGVPFVEAAEAEGFIFAGRGLLRP